MHARNNSVNQVKLDVCLATKPALIQNRLSVRGGFASSIEATKLDLSQNKSIQNQGLYSLSGKTSYRKISWSLEAARFGF